MFKCAVVMLMAAFIGTTALSQVDTTASADSLLLRELERGMEPTADQTQSGTQQRSAVSTNPKISVIGDFQAGYRSDLDKNFEFNFNEAEISFQSVVDPYARADFFLSLAKDASSGNYEADVEEAYLTTLELPMDLQLKAGKFRMSLGRINPVHPHALPFIDVPSIYENFLGDDGLNSEGFSLSWLVPNPLDFYQELTLEATETPLNTLSFSRTNSNKYFYLIHLKNFWDLTPNATLELGMTGMTGPNDSAFSTSLGALDLTYKWKPLKYNTYKSLVWQTEAFLSKATMAENVDNTSWGIYSFITYQVEKRWFLTGRFDYSNYPYSSSMVDRAYSASLGWYATEFQKIEMEGKLTTSNFRDQFSEAMLRWIFVIGSHGAHQY